jgi:hypothetical protein
MDNPTRPTREETLDPATFGRPVADMAIRRYTSADDLLDDTYDKPLEDLRGQMVALRRDVTRPHTLYMHNGEALDQWWTGCRAGGLAGARFFPNYYPPHTQSPPNGYVTWAASAWLTWGPMLTYDAPPTDIPDVPPGALAGPRIVIPGLYQIDMAAVVWRLEGPTPINELKANAIVAPNPGFVGLYRTVAEGSGGTPDSPDPGWAYRSTLSCVVALERDDWVGIQLARFPSNSWEVRPAPYGNSAQIGYSRGVFSLDLLVPF